MKFAILALLFSFSAFASITPAQMKDIRKETVAVMMDLGANPDLNPTVNSVKVISQLGERVKVKFQYTEEMYGTKTCTFYYDLAMSAAVPRSALCGL